MIVRIVTMQFKEEDINTFLAVFEKYKARIRNAEGCSYLRLIQDLGHPEQISTLSHWEDENFLNNYRNSDVFKEVWPQTKKLFIAAPRAQSYTVLSKT